MKRINITQVAIRAGGVGAIAVTAITALAFASDSPPPAQPAQAAVPLVAHVTDPQVAKFANAYAVNASPEQLAAIAAEQSAAKPAMSAYIDAESGNLRVITAEDLQANASPSAVNTGVAKYREDGLVELSLDESSAAYYVAHVDENGKLREACLENQPNAAAALAKATAEVDSNEK